jgi:hypothetical protein
MYTGNPFALLDTQTVTGALRATGSRDLDVLASARAKLEGVPKVHKVLGLALLVVGALMTLSIIGAVVGIPSALAGWWLRRRAVANLATIDAAFIDYTRAVRGDERGGLSGITASVRT